MADSRNPKQARKTIPSAAPLRAHRRPNPVVEQLLRLRNDTVGLPWAVAGAFLKPIDRSIPHADLTGSAAHEQRANTLEMAVHPERAPRYGGGHPRNQPLGTSAKMAALLEVAARLRAGHTNIANQRNL